MMAKQIILTLLAIIILFSLVCIQSLEKSVEGITTLRIGIQPTTHHIAAMMAQEKGWWLEDLEPFGIRDVKEFNYPSGDLELKALQAGDLDIAYICTAPVVVPVSKGLDAKIIAAANINGSNLVLRNGLNYDGPQSLRGLRLGTLPAGTGNDVILKKWLTDNDIKFSEINISQMAPGEAVNAMLEGKVDGVFLPQPTTAIIELAGKGKSKLSSGEMYPNHACCCIIASGKLIRENPELIVQIIKTHIRATQFANAHPEEAARIYSNYTGQSLEMVEYSIKTWDGKWIADPNVLINSTVDLAKFEHKLGYTQKDLTERDLFDTSFFDKLK